jgi:hypothetical protein
VDFDYLNRRHEEEIARADAADTEAAREAHLALAHQYLAEIERLRNEGGQGLRLATQ